MREEMLEMSNASTTLNKKDVRKAALTWWLTSHLTYNYQRLQAGSMSTVMGPVFNKLYSGDKEEMKKGLQRHMLYFNTEPRIGAFLPGMVVALEEGIATEKENNEIDASMITEIKTALMGPLAGIGDTIFSGLLKPIVLSITLGWAAQGHIWGAFAFSIIFLLTDFMITYGMFTQGYKLGMDSIDKFLEGPFMSKLTAFLGMVGLFCLGVMIVKYVSVEAILKLKLSTGNIAVGETLNKILPSCIPLGLTYLAYWLQTKGYSVTKVLLVLFVIGFIGGAVGVLG